MAQEVVGSILLACRSGRLGGLKEYGSYSSNDANKLIESKLKKG